MSSYDAHAGFADNRDRLSQEDGETYNEKQ